MPKIDEATVGRHLDKLIRDKLRDHLDWELPQFRDVIGPHFPKAFDHYEQSRSAVVSECKAKLSAFSNQEILILAQRLKDDPNGVKNEWYNYMQTEIDKLTRMRPPWYAGGFGNLKYKADFRYWSQSRYFTNHEALLLSLGVEPKYISEENALKMAEQYRKGDNTWEPLVFMLRRNEQIERQFSHAVHRGRIDPNAFFDWVALVNLDIHPQFTSRYLNSSKQHVEAGNSEVDDPPARPKTDAREINKISQLFVAIAICELGYDPTAKRSPIPQEIADLAADLGLEISHDTIRKYLRRGAQFLPRDWTPN